MKKILITIFIVSHFSMAFSQDFLGGSLFIHYTDTTSYNYYLELYTYEPMNIQRDSIALRTGGPNSFPYYIPKIGDTLLSANIRRSLFEGHAPCLSSSTGGLVVYMDTVTPSLFTNINTISSLFPYSIIANYTPSSGNYYHSSPICTENMATNTSYNNGIVTYQLNCTDMYGDSVSYYLAENIYPHPSSSGEYTLPPNLEIDSATGLITWYNPAQSGYYLINVIVKDHGTNDFGSTTMSRLVFIKVDSTMVNTREILHTEGLKVFPNPTTDHLTIKFDYYTPDRSHIQIFDMVGQLVHQQPMTRQSHQVSLRHLAEGVYIVRVQAGDKVFTRKVVKQ